MCKRVNCTQCGKIGWQGCGAHVEQVLAGVPQEERCRCREREQQPPPATPRPR